MASSTEQAYDETGKVVFDDYYVQPDPRPYFTSDLHDLDYRIPDEAQPVFRETIGALRECRGQTELHVVDLGCSYGVNAALLTTDLSLDDLYRHYSDPAVAGLERDELVAQDRRFLAEHRTDPDLSFTGIDTAAPAVRYAEDAGLLEHGIAANLEEEDLAGPGREAVGEADLVISTGAIGYVAERTVEQVLDAAEHRPWMAHCVLRMFPFAPFETMLRERGYDVERLDGTLRQRKFATDAEQAHVLDNLVELGIDPSGKEADGWYHADVFIARPADEVR